MGSPLAGEGNIVRTSIVPLIVAVLSWLAVPAAGQTPLPDENGKEAVEAHCGHCHRVNQVVNAGHSRGELETVVHMMITRDGNLALACNGVNRVTLVEMHQ